MRSASITTNLILAALLSIVTAFVAAFFVVEEARDASELARTEAEITDRFSRTIWGSDDVQTGTAHYIELRYSPAAGEAHDVQASVTEGFYKAVQTGEKIAISYAPGALDYVDFEGKKTPMSLNQWRLLLAIILWPIVFFGLVGIQSFQRRS